MRSIVESKSAMARVSCSFIFCTSSVPSGYRTENTTSLQLQDRENQSNMLISKSVSILCVSFFSFSYHEL